MNIDASASQGSLTTGVQKILLVISLILGLGAVVVSYVQLSKTASLLVGSAELLLAIIVGVAFGLSASRSR